jgi:hypothetical protein
MQIETHLHLEVSGGNLDSIIIIIIIPFIVLYKSKTIVGQFGPQASGLSGSEWFVANIQGLESTK